MTTPDVATAEIRLCDAATRWGQDGSVEAFLALRSARETLHAAIREAVGVECERCDGVGTWVYGIVPASWSSPAEPLEDTCPQCHGHGLVLPGTPDYEGPPGPDPDRMHDDPDYWERL